MTTDKKFMELYKNGDVGKSEIYDYIEKWHGSDSNESLPEYLGMTIDEYYIWVRCNIIMNEDIMKSVCLKILEDFNNNSQNDECEVCQGQC